MIVTDHTPNFSFNLNTYDIKLFSVDIFNENQCHMFTFLFVMFVTVDTIALYLV